jgi:hypothetical protein
LEVLIPPKLTVATEEDEDEGEDAKVAMLVESLVCGFCCSVVILTNITLKYKSILYFYINYRPIGYRLYYRAYTLGYTTEPIGYRLD